MGRGKREHESNAARTRSSSIGNKFSSSVCVDSIQENSQIKSLGGEVQLVDNTERMNLQDKLQRYNSNISIHLTSNNENQSNTDTRRVLVPEIKISSEENEDVCQHVIESNNSVSRKDLKRPKSAIADCYAARLEAPSGSEIRRHSLPAMKIENGSTEKVSHDGSLHGKDIAAFYSLWNRPNSPTLLGRGSLEAPKALKRKGPYRCCGCLTREEHLKRECGDKNI
ncbi:hypothetical protein CHS0354_036951 [Potamilus streckersoni]|uniref:Uncharacterized protein n=1 Tax=Potamilus streckersoni TaxID=2493646 RepID=A0AAE0TCN7_9BIVA|nr:hypothetical protein CHS0354_036951 [Potamilus streckersoni]